MKAVQACLSSEMTSAPWDWGVNGELCSLCFPRPHQPVGTNGVLFTVIPYNLLAHAPTCYCRTPTTIEVLLSYFWKSPSGITGELTKGAICFHMPSTMLCLSCSAPPIRSPAYCFLLLGIESTLT